MLFKKFLTFYFIGMSFAQIDSSFSIKIETDSIITDPVINPYKPKPKIIFENSTINAVYKLNEGGYERIEHSFVDITVKSKQLDVVKYYVDACSQRPAADSAFMIYDGDEKKTVRVLFNSTGREGIIDYTIYPNFPVIRIDYIKYDYGSWANIVDRVSLGYRKPYLFGQEDYIRDLQYNPQSFWNTYDEPYINTDPADGGSLNYNGYCIMAYGDTTLFPVVFGRVIPFFVQNEKGGIKILKLLDDGFEPYPSTGNNTANRKQFTSYIYLVDIGAINAIETGKNIVDNHLKYDAPFNTELVDVKKTQENNNPDNFSLEQNYPNPFNPSTMIKYSIPVTLSPVTVSLKVFNLLGQEVATLVNQQQPAGNYEVKFDASNLPAGRHGLASGVYIYRIQAGEFTASKKLMILK